ncbi:bile acid:sodium symporter family protein [Puniceicoccaceae bacterium K14]|nr:bile acid:sodium symporter family protein [Puniceicoccaceae bacterium K14]
MPLPRALFFVSACSLTIFVGLLFTHLAEHAHSFLIVGLLGLALSASLNPRFKGFAYSFWIIAAVSISMSFPQYFLGFGDFNSKNLIIPLLQIIMFGMGSQMSLSDFKGIIKMPKGVAVGVLCQFSIMPIIGFMIVSVFKFSPEIAAGVILVGSSPSGLASNVMAFLAKANLALSVTLTAVATLLSPVMTPFLMKLFAGQLIEIEFLKMMTSIFNMVILPICAGLIFNLFSNSSNQKKLIQLTSYSLIITLKNLLAYLASKDGLDSIFQALIKDLCIFALLPLIGAYLFKSLANGRKDWLEKVLSLISMIGIAVIITVITAAGRDSLMDVGLLLVLACTLHNLFGYTLGYLFSKLLRMDEKDCRTIALEVGMQNSGLASGLALQMGKMATVGLGPAVFGPLMNITGSSLATWWRNKK